MARPMKKVIQEVVEEPTNEECLYTIEYVLEVVERLQERVKILEKICIKPEGKLINKVEKFNDEVPSTIESYNGMKMDASDRIQSMQNAIKILPPNMVVNGRHLKENIEAICGFKVLDEMMDAAYEGMTHDIR
jgi:tetrahydromethanopterin S-methyltransferase subunit A